MKKKQYQEPTMTVVELQHKTLLLTQSGDRSVPTRGRINDWNDGGTTDDEIYM